MLFSKSYPFVIWGCLGLLFVLKLLKMQQGKHEGGGGSSLEQHSLFATRICTLKGAIAYLYIR